MDHPKPRVSDSVLYVFRPGQVRAGQAEVAAIVTKVNADDTLELITFPTMSEMVHQSRVPAMSEVITGHCWRRQDDDMAERQADAQAALVKAKSRAA